jgi:predicted acyltransferase
MRLKSLDVFRGIAIASMILVNNPGSWKHIYPPLEHAAWHGCTPTDLVFPFFLFIVGCAMSFSLSKYIQTTTKIETNIYWRIARRATILFILGLLLNTPRSHLTYFSTAPPLKTSVKSGSWEYCNGLV